jgi:hypothetical protein
MAMPEQREISMTTMGIEFLPSIMTGRRGMHISGGNKSYVSGHRSCKKTILRLQIKCQTFNRKIKNLSYFTNEIF